MLSGRQPRGVDPHPPEDLDLSRAYGAQVYDYLRVVVELVMLGALTMPGLASGV